MYKLLAFDLDGTLTNERKEITPRTRRALSACAERGISLALISGRPLIGMLPVGKSLDFAHQNGFLGAFNGAQVYECASGSYLGTRTISASLALPAALAVRRHPETALVTYDENGVVSERPDNAAVQHECRNNGFSARKVPDLVAFIRNDIPKLMAAGPHAALEEIRRELLPIFEGKADLYYSEECFLEIMPCNITKASALEMISAHLGITAQEVMSFGDANNDIPMLRYAGTGVAMGNAYDNVKAAADVIAPTNEEDGVASVIERMVLS